MKSRHVAALAFVGWYLMAPILRALSNSAQPFGETSNRNHCGTTLGVGNRHL
jgi:hypothetical protein